MRVHDFFRQIRDFLRPIPDTSLPDLHEHSLRGIRSMAKVLAILAPGGPVFVLVEHVVWARVLLSLPVHISAYLAVAWLTKTGWGRRHTGLLMMMIACCFVMSMTLEMVWASPEGTPAYGIIVSLVIACFIPWRPTAALFIAIPAMAGMFGARALFGDTFPMRMPTNGVIDGAVCCAITAAIAIQAQRRLWFKFEQTKAKAADAEQVATKRAAAIRGILDNVDEGFLRLTRDGRMSEERSAILTRWFGEATPDMTFADYIRSVDPVRAHQFVLAWEQLIEDLLPFELSITQLPTRIGDPSVKSFGLRYCPVLREKDDGETVIQEVIVIVRDMSAELEKERAESELRDLMGAVRSVLRDRNGFIEFVTEASTLVEAINDADFERGQGHGQGQESQTEAFNGLMRHIHTLKGNTALFEIDTVSRFCHELEDRLFAGEPFTSSDRERLCDLWSPIAKLAGSQSSANGPVPSSSSSSSSSSAAAASTTMNTLDVTRSEQTAFIQALIAGDKSRKELALEVQGWSDEPTRNQLNRLAERTRATAQRLGHPEIDVFVRDEGVRAPRGGKWTKLWSVLVHLLRNAIDHGLTESAEQRIAAGKQARGWITLGTSLDRDRNAVKITVEDDGRGIDWEAIRRSAVRRGLPSITDTDLVDALFSDGVTSRTDATELSGRGVGMSAVKRECLALGGSIEIDPNVTKGTRFILRIPLPHLTTVLKKAA
jgi:signal transduction histidine kinase